MKDLKKKYGEWALVTGASSGIGEAFVRDLACRGINCVIVARRLEKLQKTAAELSGKYGVKILPVGLDLTAPDFLETLDKELGFLGIDILVNNAGFGINQYFHENDPVQEEMMVRLNCLAPVMLTRHFIPGMIERKRGAVIMLSSVMAYQPSPHMSTYAATKVFDRYFGEALAFELKSHGIDVTTVLPGSTKTEFQDVSGVEDKGRYRTPEQVVKTAFRGLGRRFSVTDGVRNRIQGLVVQRLPRAWQMAAAHRILKSRSAAQQRS